jgi:serine/threonine protein phosphatase 1
MNVKQLSLSGGSRCFVVGDVAGHFSHLSQLVAQLDLNPKTDTLVLNGNFLGLAPSSRQVFAWLEKNWVTAILGVNEARILDRLNGLDVPTLAGQWMAYLSESERSRLIVCLQALPVALEVRYEENYAVVSHAPLPSTRRWRELRDEILGWTGPAHKVLDLFESRLLGLTALGHLSHVPISQQAGVLLSLSSLSMEKPKQPVLRKGRYAFLVGSAHMNHGTQYANACLLPYVELTTLTGQSTEEMLWKGSLDTRVK